ncbi:MAG: hypothetical protein M1835_005239 [Candelina submexicana]|nr:MAG: hypothetical protein M1835_005239 [Candelina submexicana]
MKSILATLLFFVALSLAAPIQQIDGVAARGDTDPVMSTPDGTDVKPFDPAGIVKIDG